MAIKDRRLKPRNQQTESTEPFFGTEAQVDIIENPRHRAAVAKGRSAFAAQSAELLQARQRQRASAFFSGVSLPDTMLGSGLTLSERRRKKARATATPLPTLLGGGYAA